MRHRRAGPSRVTFHVARDVTRCLVSGSRIVVGFARGSGAGRHAWMRKRELNDERNVDTGYTIPGCKLEAASATARRPAAAASAIRRKVAD
eukprot:7379692-Prymnesium_polylepis.1